VATHLVRRENGVLGTNLPLNARSTSDPIHYKPQKRKQVIVTYIPMIASRPRYLRFGPALEGESLRWAKDLRP